MKRFFKSSMMTAFLFVLSVLLLSIGAIGGTRAALQIESNLYQSQISMKNIGVTLVENGKDVSYRNYDKVDASLQWSEHTGYLIENMVKDAGDKALKIGKSYPFALSVKNSGSIDQYVRVSIYKYFVDATGNKIAPNEFGWFNGTGIKQTNISPDLIDITLANTGVWKVDESSSTPERTVLYYTGNNGILNCEGNGSVSTVPFTESLKINTDVTKIFTTTSGDQGDSTQTYIYASDGIGIVVEAQVDAVQTRHPNEARTSAWGRVG